MYIATQLLVGLFASTEPVTLTLPEACAEVWADQSSVYCQPHAVGAPEWGAEVCCAGEACYLPTPYGCGTLETPMACAFGELVGGDEVQCYFEVANFCDKFDCPSPAEIPGYEEAAQTQSDLICCSYGSCTPYNEDLGDCPAGDIYNCIAPYSNGDGTIGCADWD